MQRLKDKILHKYAGAIREKAISRAKARIALSGRSPSALAEEDLEIIVKEEEDKVKQLIYASGLGVAMVLLGIY